jgi:hypothetical protein
LDEYEDDPNLSPKKRQEYAQELSDWLTIQFEHIRNGDNHQLKATLGELSLPNPFLDSP